MIVCKRLCYSGRVQGVGFRYTTQRLARGFAVAGYVRNLPNGEVELIAQGEADEVGAFLDAVGKRMSEYIERQAASDESPGDFKDFTVRH